MKFYSFHPGMKLTCKQKVFHPRASFIPGWDSVLVTCKHTLNGLNDKTQRTVIGNEYLILVLYQFHSLKARDLFWKDCAWKDWPYWGTSFFQGSRHWCQNFLIWRHRQFFFLFWHVSLAKCSYWYKFHVNIIAGSGVMTIFNYKGLTRNPEIGNSSIWVFPNIWRLGQVRDTKFNTNTNVSNEMLLNAVKCLV